MRAPDRRYTPANPPQIVRPAIIHYGAAVLLAVLTATYAGLILVWLTGGIE